MARQQARTIFPFPWVKTEATANIQAQIKLAVPSFPEKYIADIENITTERPLKETIAQMLASKYEKPNSRYTAGRK